MRRSKYLKSRTPEEKEVYMKQKKYCSRLYIKERKLYFTNLDLTNIVLKNYERNL